MYDTANLSGMSLKVDMLQAASLFKSSCAEGNQVSGQTRCLEMVRLSSSKQTNLPHDSQTYHMTHKLTTWLARRYLLPLVQMAPFDCSIWEVWSTAQSSMKVSLLLKLFRFCDLLGTSKIRTTSLLLSWTVPAWWSWMFGKPFRVFVTVSLPGESVFKWIFSGWRVYVSLG